MTEIPDEPQAVEISDGASAPAIWQVAPSDETGHINPAEFPATSEALRYAYDIDGYLEHLGIDTTDLVADEDPA